MAIGPIQLVVLGFEGDDFSGKILEELRKLREHDVIRLVDLMFVRKDSEGNVEAIERSDLDAGEASEFGAYVGALIGLGAAGEEGAEAGALAGAEALEDGHVFDEDQVWYLADEIPEDTAVAVALLEHRWAIPLREAIQDTGGSLISDAWIHQTDLVGIGLAAALEQA